MNVRKTAGRTDFGWGIKNLVLYIVIVNSIVFGQDKRMRPVLGKGFILYLSSSFDGNQLFTDII